MGSSSLGDGCIAALRYKADNRTGGFFSVEFLTSQGESSKYHESNTVDLDAPF